MRHNATLNQRKTFPKTYTYFAKPQDSDFKVYVLGNVLPQYTGIR